MINSYKDAGRPIVYINESGFSHDMPRTHGYSEKGQRCYGKQDWGAKSRINVIFSFLGKTLLTISLFSANINTDIFTAWVEQDLLLKLPANAVIIIDNATFHKNQHMQETIRNAGHTLEYLPPYSPDLNLIEPK